MNLALDIGNTSIKAALFDQEKLTEAAELQPHDLAALCQRVAVQRVAVSKVGRSDDWRQALPTALQQHVHVLSSASKLPITLSYATPHTLGADRVAAAVGAVSLFPCRPLLVIDAGTCITIDYVDAQGTFRGGAILPGINLKLTALHEHTALLPAVPFDSRNEETMPSLVGTTTAECILAGTATATALTVEAFVNRYATQHPDLHVLLTGGDAAWLHRVVCFQHTLDNHLLLKGLNTILSLN